MFVFRWNKKSEILGIYQRMKKEKVELTKKGRGRAGSSSTSNRRSKPSGKNKSFVSRECEEDLNLKKRVIIKNDGRYLIYYDF